MSSPVKYPSTPYLPWTAQADENDTILDTSVHFEGRRVIVTEKMDGENTSLYHDRYHARSVDSRHHPSRDYVKRFWATFNYLIPEDIRICGENVYAQHSVAYESLSAYFLGFSVWRFVDGVVNDICLSWDDTMEWFERLGICPVPVLYDGQFDQELIHQAWLDKCGGPEASEGYVIRNADSFPRAWFCVNLAKYVRENHVQTDEHWMTKPVVPNGLA
jgi:hypothetical protein